MCYMLIFNIIFEHFWITEYYRELQIHIYGIQSFQIIENSKHFFRFYSQKP